MDPSADLKELLALARSIQAHEDRGTTPPRGYPERLAELVLALDQWMRQGGFAPADWRLAGRQQKGTEGGN